MEEAELCLVVVRARGSTVRVWTGGDRDGEVTESLIFAQLLTHSLTCSLACSMSARVSELGGSQREGSGRRGRERGGSRRCVSS